MQEIQDMAEERAGRRRDNWHVDRGVPVSLIVTLVVQSIALVAAGSWFVAIQSSKLESMAERMSGVEKTVDVRMTTVERKIDAAVATVNMAQVPSGQQAVKLDYHEARINEMRAEIGVLARRLSVVEAQQSRERERR